MAKVTRLPLLSCQRSSLYEKKEIFQNVPSSFIVLIRSATVSVVRWRGDTSERVADRFRERKKGLGRTKIDAGACTTEEPAKKYRNSACQSHASCESQGRRKPVKTENQVKRRIQSIQTENEPAGWQESAIFGVGKSQKRGESRFCHGGSVGSCIVPPGVGSAGFRPRDTR